LWVAQIVAEVRWVKSQSNSEIPSRTIVEGEILHVGSSKRSILIEINSLDGLPNQMNKKP